MNLQMTIETMRASGIHLQANGDRLSVQSKVPLTEDQVADTTGTPTLGAIEHLYQAIADQVDQKAWRDSSAFVAVGKFSQEGKKWAKEKLAPLCKEYDIPKRFNDMVSGDIVTLLMKLDREDLAKLLIEKPEESNTDESW